MSEEKAKANDFSKEEAKLRKQEVNVLETLQLLDKTMTQSLCENIFKSRRTNERQRLWSLHAMYGFWTAVILRAPQSLQQALNEAAEGKNPDWPHVPATPEAFFQRSRDLSWEFFHLLYEAFVKEIKDQAPAIFAKEFEILKPRFTGIWIVDGSRLDAIAHRLKILWQERCHVLPGSLTACYDLFRGYAPLLHFSEDAAQAEMERFRDIISQIPEGILLMGDRLYANPQAFELLEKGKISGLFRLNGAVSVRKLKCLSRKKITQGVLEDWEVEVGSGQTAPKRIMRAIFLKRKDGALYELLTSVLDPGRLSAEEAMALYPYRWRVEDLFYDLKEVLNLHHFYCANVNAIGMQVYAAGLVHVAMRISQARIARDVGIAPERISTEKFFPRMAAAASIWTGAQVGAQAMRDANPDLKLQEPYWKKMKFARICLGEILVEPRKGPRRKTRDLQNWRKWKSFAHISPN